MDLLIVIKERHHLVVVRRIMIQDAHGHGTQFSGAEDHGIQPGLDRLIEPVDQDAQANAKADGEQEEEGRIDQEDSLESPDGKKVGETGAKQSKDDRRNGHGDEDRPIILLANVAQDQCIGFEDQGCDDPQEQQHDKCPEQYCAIRTKIKGQHKQTRRPKGQERKGQVQAEDADLRHIAAKAV